MRDDNQIVNGLWIGDSLSKLELLTINSFIANGHIFKLWIYDKISTPLPKEVLIGDATTIIPRDQVFAYNNVNKYGHGKGSYAGFSDIFRYKLLYEKGGWWVDMDVTCLKPLDFDKPYFFRSHHDLMVVGNVMKCPRHSELMKLCYEVATANVDANNTDWHKPIEILNDHIAQLKLTTYINEELSNHDRWDETSQYIWTEKHLPKEWYFIHWQNEEWRSKKVNKDSFYYNSAIGRLMTQYQLVPTPSNSWQRLRNKIAHSPLARKIRSRQ